MTKKKQSHRAMQLSQFTLDEVLVLQEVMIDFLTIVDKKTASALMKIWVDRQKSIPDSGLHSNGMPKQAWTDRMGAYVDKVGANLAKP